MEEAKNDIDHFKKITNNLDFLYISDVVFKNLYIDVLTYSLKCRFLKKLHKRWMDNFLYRNWNLSVLVWKAVIVPLVYRETEFQYNIVDEPLDGPSYMHINIYIVRAKI